MSIHIALRLCVIKAAAEGIGMKRCYSIHASTPSLMPFRG